MCGPSAEVALSPGTETNFKVTLACPNVIILKINYLKKELLVILTNTFVCILSLSLQSTENL